MTALLDLTAELPVWAVGLAGVASFLLGVGAREAQDRRHDGCERCASNARHHARLAERAAWAGWPGHHATVAFDYGAHLDPTVLEEPYTRLPHEPAPDPTGHEVRVWTLTERLIEAARWENPLTTGELLVEQALAAFKTAATRELESLDA